MGQAAIAKEAGIHPYAVKKAIEAMRRYSAVDAKKALVCVQSADRLIKGGIMGPGEALDVLIVDLAGKYFLLGREA
jgi:DNA polymerase III delta subunit